MVGYATEKDLREAWTSQGAPGHWRPGRGPARFHKGIGEFCMYRLTDADAASDAYMDSRVHTYCAGLKLPGRWLLPQVRRH